MRNTTNTITGPQYGTSREMPWNVMGAELTGKSHKSLQAALSESGLDYDVEVWDTIATDPLTGRTLESPKAAQIVRPTPDGLKVVGSTGRRFTPIQNRDAFAVAEDLVGSFGAVISGMADFRHGGASIMVLDLQRPVDLVAPDGTVDRVDLDLLVKNAHDGSSALTFALTPMRLACTNALQAAVRDAQRSWKISHTPNAMERVSLARTAIQEAVGYHEHFAQAAQAMMDAPMVDAEFAKIVASLWKVAPDAEGKVAERKRDTQAQVVDLFQNSPTLEHVRGTRWAGYNAVTEYLDHYRPVKGDETQARAEGALEGPNVRVKGNVWKMFAAA
jgi:phage/plasmid-like protein (TIGR03299 family)